MNSSALLLIAVWLLPQARPADAPRELPSKYVTCPRDHLTNYSGVVVAYRREAGRTLLTIRTDWDTTERVELKHPGTEDPSRWFLLRGRPFTPDDWKDIFSDVLLKAKPWDVGHAHQGFGKALEPIWKPLEGALNLLKDRPVWFTGHSLGGALATLAAFRRRQHPGGVYTFGSPRVGNGVFAGSFDGVYMERSVRYVNDHDAVTHVPSEIVAFPHGRTLAVRDLSIAFARSARGVDFDSTDKKPTHAVFLIIAPPQDRDNVYLQVLGRIVDLIKDDASRDRVVGAANFAELKTIIEGQGL